MNSDSTLTAATNQQLQSGLYLGIMSGTSVDGIDIALVKQTDTKTEFLQGAEYPYPPSVRQNILDLCQSQHTSLVNLGTLTEQITKAYADAINTFIELHQLNRSEIIAIGVHGQTVCHQPSGDFPFSMQLVNPALLAAKTSITTVHDFRSMDIALGGQGAPLVPLFHQTLFDKQDDDTALIFLNIGGIANISVVNPKPLIGFDTGPGNVLLDAWIHKTTGKKYDSNGEFAVSGQVNESLLNQLMQEPYFQLPAPKSSGRELFNLNWLEQQLANWQSTASDANTLSNQGTLANKDTLTNKDIMATLVELTTKSIVDAIKQVVKEGKTGKLLVCGGGAKNTAIMLSLTKQLPNWQVSDTDSQGISADYMEAMAFAWLAYRCINGLAGNSPQVTGASRAEVCGSVTRVHQ